jgi:hypothetical protein
MASIEELMGALSDAVNKQAETHTVSSNCDSLAGEVAGVLNALSAHGTAQQVEAAAEKVREALSLQTSAKAALEEAQALAQSATEALTTGPTAPAAPVTHKPRQPEPLQHQDMVSGEELVQRGQETADSTRNRLSRLGRVAARQSDEVNEAARSLTNQAVESVKAFRRLPDLPPETGTETGTPPVVAHAPYGSTPSAGDVTSTLATLALGGAVVFQKLSHRRTRREGPHNDNKG